MLREEINKLQNTLRTLCKKRYQHALTANSGSVNLINCGFNHVKEVFETETAENLILPREDLEYCFIKLLQRAQGCFNLKQTGTDMTNGMGSICLIFSIVASGLVGITPDGSAK